MRQTKAQNERQASDEIKNAPRATSGGARADIGLLAKALSDFRAAAPLVPPSNPGLTVRPVGEPVFQSFLRRLKRADTRLSETPLSPSHSFLWNAPLDVQWAHRHASFDRVLHVFHQDWHGIRAAAGYFPGQKLAIPVEPSLTEASLRLMAEQVQTSQPTAVLIHGWSPNARKVAHTLRASIPLKTRIGAVWHGNTSQFMNPFEFEVVGQMLRLRAKGVIDTLLGVKPDLHHLDPAFHSLPLLNLPPRVGALDGRRVLSNTALVPVPNDWRKNYFTNVFAASAAGVEEVLVTTPMPRGFPLKVRARIREVPRPSREALFAMLPKIGIVMNASLSECQPMTALEALAFRVPAVTPRLELGMLDHHPYQKLAQVEAVDTLGPVQRAARNLLDLARQKPDELNQMLSDYANCLEKASFERLAEVIS